MPPLVAAVCRHIGETTLAPTPFINMYVFWTVRGCWLMLSVNFLQIRQCCGSSLRTLETRLETEELFFSLSVPPPSYPTSTTSTTPPAPKGLPPSLPPFSVPSSSLPSSSLPLSLSLSPPCGVMLLIMKSSEQVFNKRCSGNYQLAVMWMGADGASSYAHYCISHQYSCVSLMGRDYISLVTHNKRDYE